MRILVIHNQLWAHYKSTLFEEIHRELRTEFPDSEFLVAQIALYESSRASMAGSEETVEFDYPYRVLFDKSLDSVSLFERIKGVFRVFHAFRPDVVNITGYYDWAQLLLLIYARLKGVRTVISVESSQADRSRSMMREFIKKGIFKLTDAFFCFGRSSVGYLLVLGVPERKIAVQRAAVVDNDRILARFQAARAKQKRTEPSGHNFIYVGRLASEKNLLTLLEAYRMCLSDGATPAWGLLLVGEGPMREKLQAYTKENGLTKVRFTGGVPWQSVPDYLAQADVLILPSYSEPWGLVVNEALVCAMPVIVSDKCGCAEDLVQHGQNGFVFDPQHVDSLAGFMGHYMKNPGEVRRQGSLAKKIIAPFSPQITAREMVHCYAKLTHPTPTPCES